MVWHHSFCETRNGGRMTELLESIGHNIRRLRDEKGWNQTELGFRADASPSIISLIENGKRNPSTATLAKIAGALGVEVVDLFPKATAPPPEASFDELMAAELRGGATDADIIKDFESITRDYRMSWRGALEDLAAPWVERLRSGAFDRSMVEQFFTDVAAVSQGVALALRTGVTEALLQNKYKPPPTAEDFEEIQKTSLTYAAVHILKISDEVYAA